MVPSWSCELDSNLSVGLFLSLLYCYGLDIPGVCASAHLWQVWLTASTGGYSLLADLPLALCVRRKVSWLCVCPPFDLQQTGVLIGVLHC